MSPLAADGSIIIDTRIDTSGMNAGALNVEKSFSGLAGKIKKIGIAIGAAFAVKQIVSFGVESSKAARQAADSMQGLQSILEGQGRSFSEAKSFIDEYISDGLIPATNATTAYKNLASRGYDDTQIQQVLVALKDASAYGRQASYSMGEAVQSATEGLKNENSVLVDNAGVTKNVAKMWEDYAKSIGTTTNNLTQQQKIQAEVTGILAETKFQTGDAAKVAGTLSGQLQQLSFNFNNLKVAVGNIVNPFVKVFLPVINTAINAVTKFANRIASVVNSFFGTSMNGFEETSSNIATGLENAATGADALTSSTNNATKATKRAAKEANKYLSPLDQINRYSSNKSAADTSVPSSGDGTSGVSSAIAGGYDAIAKGNGVIDQATSKFSEFAAKMKSYLAPLTEQLQRFGNIAKSAFTWFLNNVLKPLGNFTVNEILPRFFNTLANVLKIFNNILVALQPLWQWFWNKILSPIATWTGGVFLKVWDLINNALERFAKWCEENPKKIETIAIIIGSFFAAFLIVGLVEKILAIVNAIASFSGVIATLSTVMGAGSLMSGLFGKAIAALTSPAGIAVAAIGAIIAIGVLLWKNWDTIKEKAKEIWGNITTYLSEKWAEIKENASNIAAKFKEVFLNAWESIKATAKTAWTGITTYLSTKWFEIRTKATTSFNTLKTTINGVWESIKAKAAEIWDGIKTKITTVASSIRSKVTSAFLFMRDSIKGAFTGVVAKLKDPINKIITFINNLITKINGLIGHVNSALSFDVSFTNPFTGAKVGFWHTMNIPTIKTIPYLAKGAVIPPNAPFTAILGDQRHGTNIEAPLDTIKQALREVMGEGYGNQKTNGKYQFTAQINRRTLFDEMITEAQLRRFSNGRNPFELA